MLLDTIRRNLAIDTVLREVYEDIVVVDTHTLDELVARIMPSPLRIMNEWLEDDRRIRCRRQERFKNTVGTAEIHASGEKTATLREIFSQVSSLNEENKPLNL